MRVEFALYLPQHHHGVLGCPVAQGPLNNHKQFVARLRTSFVKAAMAELGQALPCLPVMGLCPLRHVRPSRGRVSTCVCARTADETSASSAASVRPAHVFARSATTGRAVSFAWPSLHRQ